MAKKTLLIAPKLADRPPALPVQTLDAGQIEQLVRQTQQQHEPPAPSAQDFRQAENRASDNKPKRQAKSAPAPKNAKKPKAKKPRNAEPDPDKRPQGRPPRQEAVRRLSSDLPEDIYNKVQAEIRKHGYTLNGFLARVLREYFERSDH